MIQKLQSDELVAALKATAEPTRLRILVLLMAEELNVKDLTQILSQSQPRISRHLKLLVESGLIERFPEGSWVYFHVSERTQGGMLVRAVLDMVDADDPTLRRDFDRLQSLKREREVQAQKYFQKHASHWDQIRSLHIPEKTVETAMRKALGSGPFDFMVDLGTGTGRVLEVFADRYRRGLGFDVNQAMLSYARSKFSTAGLTHAEVRHGDIYNLSLADNCGDCVVMHQVLHFLSEPGHAIEEAARILAPGGKLLMVDFAPHDLEFLRSEHAHERLGFSEPQVKAWLDAAGLTGFEHVTLAPGEKADKEQLTVSLWTAQQAKAKTQKPAARPAPAMEALPR